ncbi:hypothetical protein CYMTET_14481 [Cymbomonas tetramitiformis]|uniref:Uncharacterized protein n=1 Tax=Cymbomonas tetramitiformis TaxID=36881 RepID=A0AAE0LA46_9CHLO|nr:hypothetical protein CYMTET_14481 [Cymbomonas tetramitiformis]
MAMPTHESRPQCASRPTLHLAESRCRSGVLLVLVVLASGLLGSEGGAFEDTIARVTQEVRLKFGATLELREALGCGIAPGVSPLACDDRVAMSSVEDAPLLRFVYIYRNVSKPNYAAYVDRAAGNITYVKHDDDFVGDSVLAPYPAKFSAEDAVKLMRSVNVSEKFNEFVLRRPLYRCVSETLYTFVFATPIPWCETHEGMCIIVVGASTGKVCHTFVTSPCEYPPTVPQCYGDPELNATIEASGAPKRFTTHGEFLTAA